MDYSTLTNEQVNERLAIEVMGWRWYQDYEDSPRLWDNDGKAVMLVADWNPAEDLNQTVMCAEKWTNSVESGRIFIEYSNTTWQVAAMRKGAIHITLIADTLSRALAEAILQAVDNG